MKARLKMFVHTFFISTSKTTKNHERKLFSIFSGLSMLINPQSIMSLKVLLANLLSHPPAVD